MRPASATDNRRYARRPRPRYLDGSVGELEGSLTDFVGGYVCRFVLLVKQGGVSLSKSIASCAEKEERQEGMGVMVCWVRGEGGRVGV